MPVVMRVDGLRVIIWPNDHRPAHVHVMGAGGEAVFELNCPNGPPALRESFGFKLHDLNWVRVLLIDSLPALCANWSAIHGPY